MTAIRQKERDTIIRALRSGVVPTTGLQHIQVGRYNELRSFLTDIANVADGGSAFRLVIGEYGAGKTFFLSLARQMAMEKGLVTMHADLSPSRRLYGRDGQGRGLVSQLVASMSTRTRRDGGALQNVLDRLLTRVRDKAAAQGITTHAAAASLLADIKDYPGGYAFAEAVEAYCRAAGDADDRRMHEALRWLRAEYATRGEAHRELGVRDHIDDRSFFQTLVLYSVLVRKAGYKGLYVCLDEMVNLYKITNAATRKANYEEVLNILNNTLQGNVHGLGIVMGGTPEFLTDGYRGLYSYEALRSRLAENSFCQSLGLTDSGSTVLRLPSLTPEEMYLLLRNLRNVFAKGEERDWLVPDSALTAYLNHAFGRIGESYFRTPRNTIKGFIDMLSLLEQHPGTRWQDLVDGIDIAPDTEPSALGQPAHGHASAAKTLPPDNDAFATFTL